MNQKRSIVIVFWLMLVVFAFVCKILWKIFWKFSKMDIPARQHQMQQWALQLLKIMHITLDQQGQALLTQKCLRASNHVSWLDIVVMYACGSCRFIAKSEVEHFPLVGHIAKNAGTLFLKRSSLKDAIRISRAIGQAISEGGCVCFFPESTTSEGQGVLPMHASLFEGAVLSESQVQAAVLRFYTGHSTRACSKVAYVHTSLLVTLWHILRQKELTALLVGMQPIEVNAKNTRKQICTQVQQQIETTLIQLNYNQKLLLNTLTMDEPYQALEESDRLDVVNCFHANALNYIFCARKGLEVLRVDRASRATLIQVRQSFHLLKGGAWIAGFTSFSRATQACEQCLDDWIAAKKAVTLEVIDFVSNTLTDFEGWLNALLHSQSNDYDQSTYIMRAEQLKSKVTEEKSNKNIIASV